MKNLYEDVMKTTNPQDFFQKLGEANKSLVESFTKQASPKALKEFSEAPKKALDNLKKYSDLNEKFAKDMQDIGEKTPLDVNGFVKATVAYQQSLLETNTAIIKNFYNGFAESVKDVSEKK